MTKHPDGRPAAVRRRLLRKKPRPLINTQYNFVMLWSPKCGSASLAIWFFKTAGLATEAQRHHRWPHRYRTERHYQSAYHVSALKNDPSRYTYLRIVRDPYSRAVSSYQHAVVSGYWDKRIGEILGRPVDPENGYSFHEFLESLGEINIRGSNTHHRVQMHPVEEVVTPKYVINISKQNLFEALNAFEADMGMPLTDFAANQWIDKVQGRRQKAEMFTVDGDAVRTVFSKTDARTKNWPKRNDFLTDETRAVIRSLYDIDFRQYASVL